MVDVGALPGLHAVLDAWAATTPEASAAEDAEGCWSYQELQQAALRAVAVLRRANVVGHAAPNWEEHPLGPRPVALAMPRGRWWYALCYASWRLGIPIAAASDDMSDKAAEQERGARIARELQPQAAIVLSDAASRLPGLPADCRIFNLDEFVSACMAEAAADVHLDPALEASSPVSPSSVLIYSYTGGTTKHSKCSVVTHEMSLWEMQKYPLLINSTMSGKDRVLQYTSAYWGAACFGQLDIALAFGACLVFTPTEPGARGLAAAVEDRAISVLGIVPSLLRAVYPGGPSTKPSCLKVVMTWGEKFQVKLSRPWKQVCTVIDLLIATEYWLALYSDCSTWQDPTDNQEKHILKALPGLDMLLLGADGEPVPPAQHGKEGELLLTGPTVFPGFIDSAGKVGAGPDTLDSMRYISGRRYFCTKDRMKWLSDGTLIYCGRSGTLAKRGGAWVDLEAIEAKICGVDGITAATVLCARDGTLETFVSLEAPAHGAFRVLEEARRAAGAGARLHVLSELPRNAATSKVDRRRLQLQLDGRQERETLHAKSLAMVQRRMLRSYCAWYVLSIVLLVLPGTIRLAIQMALAASSWHALWDLAGTLPLRLFVMPYLWAALVYTPLLPMKAKARTYYERYLGQTDFLLLLSASLPRSCLCATLAFSCAGIAWLRHSDALGATPPMALGLALLASMASASEPPPLFQMLLCIGCCMFISLPFRQSRVDRCFLLGVPISFYLVLPKLLSDDWLWRLDRGEASLIRRLLAWLFVPFQRHCWDAAWRWTDNGRSTMLRSNKSAPVRVATANKGLSLTLDFWEDVVAAKTIDDSNGSTCQGLAKTTCSSSQSSALNPEEAALARLAQQAGGDPFSLGRMDSLQGIVFAELIRKNLGLRVTVADVLRSQDVRELSTTLESRQSSAEQEDTGSANQLGQPDDAGAYRVFALQFPRHPVDWCLRYTGPGHIDREALQRAVDRVVARHSALRTVETPDEALREVMDKVAGMWQLWSTCLGSNSRCWHILSNVVGAALLGCWPRTTVRSAEDARIEVKVPDAINGRTRLPGWDWASHDQYVHSAIQELLAWRRWPLDVALVPLFYGERPVPAGAEPMDAAQLARTLPPDEVSWYIYCSITHAYSDGLSGQALFGDLVRFYAEEAGQKPKQPLSEAPEHLSLLQRRLARSLCGRTPGCVQDPNNELYHEGVCDDWGKRRGITRRVYVENRASRALRIAATDVLGCGIDVAWLTAIVGAIFRQFPEQSRIDLVLKAACRDGRGEAQMVGFLSEARLLTVDVGDTKSATLLDVHSRIATARLARDWKAPGPYEMSMCVYVNIVSAMGDSAPAGFQDVVKEAHPPTNWSTIAYCHLNIRIDQLSSDNWDFRIFGYDAEWGWEWSTCFAHSLGNVIRELALAPLSPLLSDSATECPSRLREGKRSLESDGDTEAFSQAPPPKALRSGA